MDIKKFKKRIAEAIKYSGYTTKELADKLGVSVNSIYFWRRGTRQPSMEMLYYICKILDESADYLLGLDN